MRRARRFARDDVEPGIAKRRERRRREDDPSASRAEPRVRLVLERVRKLRSRRRIDQAERAASIGTRSAGRKTRASASRSKPTGLKTSNDRQRIRRWRKARGQPVQAGIEQLGRRLRRLMGEVRLAVPLQIARLDMFEPGQPGIGRAPGVLVEQRHRFIRGVDLRAPGSRSHQSQDRLPRAATARCGYLTAPCG